MCNLQTCFDIGRFITQGDNRQYEWCPKCGSWNYGLNNLSLNKLDESCLYTVDYDAPSVRIELYSSCDEWEATKIINRLRNLKWGTFKEIILSRQLSQQTEMYLNKTPCLMNNFMPA